MLLPVCVCVMVDVSLYTIELLAVIIPLIIYTTQIRSKRANKCFILSYAQTTNTESSQFKLRSFYFESKSEISLFTVM